jgi:cell division protein FtsB
MVETFAIEYKRVLEERDQLHKKCQVLEDENRALKEKNHSLENEIAILENENTFFKTDNNTMYNVLGISPGVPPLPPAEVSV